MALLKRNFFIVITISVNFLIGSGVVTVQGLGVEREDEVDNAYSDGDTLNVYVIPHSHMDVGWVYTVKESMHAYAANVYTTVIAELGRNPARRFIAVEQEFFRLWWDGVATEKQKSQTRKFVSNGQLEFIIGGQVMHDEAVTELSAIIQQMTEGHAFIYETFGVRPRFGWHVDPFGATAATPTLFALMGFNAHLTSRINYDQKAAMMKAKGLQFVWQASPSLGSSQSMFTHVMDTYSYCAPMEHPPFSNRSAYMWNGVAKFPDPPADGIYPNMSDPVTTQNMGQYADFMVANIRKRAAWFKTPHLLWPWGCDKQFFNATDQYENMERLLVHINQQRSKYNIKIRQATLGQFFTALHNSDTTWDVKNSGDFIPYSTAREEAWTGFYTSRIELKGIARASQATLRAGETLFSLYTHLFNISRTINTTSALEKIKKLRWATAEVQHHDGVTGTEAPVVRDMYISHLRDGSQATISVLTDILNELTQVNARETEHHNERYNVLGLKSEISEGKSTLTYAVYNSLGWTVRRLVRIEVNSPNVTVLDARGQPVISQVNPPSNGSQLYQLYFFATIPPIGYQIFVLLFINENQRLLQSQCPTVRSYGAATEDAGGMDEGEGRGDSEGDEISIENECYKISFDRSTNALSSITNKQNGKTTTMSAGFLEYHVFHDVLYGQTSNNYVFRPYGPATVIGSVRTQLNVSTGVLVNETTQHFYGLFDVESRYSVTMRLINDASGHPDKLSCSHIEVDFKVGPLSMNKELVYRFSTLLKSNGNLYADVNAFQTMNRSRRHGATIAQNFYPMVSSAYIEDASNDERLMLLSERSHGVSSQSDGDIEVMLHRRVVNNEFETHNYNLTLEEPSVATSTFWLLLGNASTTSELRHRSWLQLENPPVAVQLGSGWSSVKEVNWSALQSRRFHSAIANVLPKNIHLLTFKTPGWNYNVSAKTSQSTGGSPLNLSRILLRLQHLYEVGEHPILSRNVTVDLQMILSPLGMIKTVDERSLTGIWNITQMNRWKWRRADEGRSQSPDMSISNTITHAEPTTTLTTTTEPTTTTAPAPTTTATPPSFTYTLQPQEIKTFFVIMNAPTE
ncbi:epididymis-specific alpha-mannosidase [Strongylocentrotus purpuratus]|uniref:Alpha-mannosidase n=1 Tax=Strongylocentrotus purpuratus TaxID=7668 RepID=A0A7M7HMR7_STRPU|nr:epididymis-specific alpha-mannosidase [Strongylocentrotus purpuratus]